MSTTPTTAPPGRLLLTGYAVAQLFLSFVLIVLFVLWVVGGVLVVVWVGLGILVARAAGDPVDREPAPVDGRRACSGTRCRRRTVRCPPGGFFAKARTVLADPMTWRDLALAARRADRRLAVSLIVIILLLGDRHRLHLVVRRRRR